METSIKDSQFKAEDISILSSKNELLSGIITGQLAGLIMAVAVMAVFTLFIGTGPLFPVQVIGSALLGEKALVGINFTAVLTGVLLHQLGPSLLWGVVFGMIASKLSITTPKATLGLGLLIGVISMVGPYVLIPAVMNTLQGQDFWNENVPMIWDWAAHLIFGASFIFYPFVLKKVPGTF